MKTQQPVLVTSITCGATALAPRLFCSLVGTLPAAGAWCPGVVDAATDPGQQAPVVVAGIALVTAGGAIAAGAQVEASAAGKAVTLSTGAAIGRALDAATADGDLIRILL